MYLTERRRRIKYQERILNAREYVNRTKTLPDGTKRVLKAYLKP